MKRIVNALVILIMVSGHSGISQKIAVTEKSGNRKYIFVEARVRLYDSSVLYKPYEPFKTRTVQLLEGYIPSQTPGKLSKYGGCPKQTPVIRLPTTGLKNRALPKN